MTPELQLLQSLLEILKEQRKGIAGLRAVYLSLTDEQYARLTIARE
jgi:hypothetical protein